MLVEGQLLIYVADAVTTSIRYLRLYCSYFEETLFPDSLHQFFWTKNPFIYVAKLKQRKLYHFQLVPGVLLKSLKTFLSLIAKRVKHVLYLQNWFRGLHVGK